MDAWIPPERIYDPATALAIRALRKVALLGRAVEVVYSVFADVPRLEEEHRAMLQRLETAAMQGSSGITVHRLSGIGRIALGSVQAIVALASRIAPERAHRPWYALLNEIGQLRIISRGGAGFLTETTDGVQRMFRINERPHPKGEDLILWGIGQAIILGELRLLHGGLKVESVTDSASGALIELRNQAGGDPDLGVNTHMVFGIGLAAGIRSGSIETNVSELVIDELSFRDHNGLKVLGLRCTEVVVGDVD